jgi:hypothetical protein
VCSAGFVSVIGIQPFRFLFKFGAAVPLTLGALSGLVLAPFSSAQRRFIVISISARARARALLRLFVTEPASFIFGSWGLSFFPSGESAIFVTGNPFRIGIAGPFFVFPSVELAISSGLALLLIRAECTTWASGIPVFSLTTPGTQWSWLDIPSFQLFIRGIAVLKESVSEVESVILCFIRIIWLRCWSVCQIERAFAANARGSEGGFRGAEYNIL